MKTSLVIWGLILIIGFYVSDWLLLQGYNAAWIWIAWAIIFNVGHYAVGKTMKKVPKNIWMLWMEMGIFGFIATVVIALGLVPLNMAFLMALWFLIVGAILFASAHQTKDSITMASSVILVFSAIFVPAFGNSYFLAGALIMGLLTLLHGFAMEK